MCLTLELVSSMALMGLLMLFTNLLTCSKCRVISVASTMSIMACRRVRNWFLNFERLREFSTGSVWVIWNTWLRMIKRTDTFPCFWRCYTCCLVQWAGTLERRGDSPGRPCRCTEWPAHCLHCTGMSWCGPGDQRHGPLLPTVLLLHPTGQDCPANTAQIQ